MPCVISDSQSAKPAGPPMPTTRNHTCVTSAGSCERLSNATLKTFDCAAKFKPAKPSVTSTPISNSGCQNPLSRRCGRSAQRNPTATARQPMAVPPRRAFQHQRSATGRPCKARPQRHRGQQDLGHRTTGAPRPFQATAMHFTKFARQSVPSPTCCIRRVSHGANRVGIVNLRGPLLWSRSLAQRSS